MNCEFLGNVYLSPTLKKILIKDIKLSKKSDFDKDEMSRIIYMSKSVEEFNTFPYVYKNNFKMLFTETRRLKLVYKDDSENDKLVYISNRSLKVSNLNTMKFSEIIKLCSISKANKKQLRTNLNEGSKPKVNIVEIPKKNSIKPRIIFELEEQREKEIQKKLNRYVNLLQFSMFENLPVFAYIEGRSYRDYLEMHCCSKSLLKLDIKEFFNSITEDNLKSELKLLIKDELLVEVLINKAIVKHDGSSILGQGLPLAAQLSNLFLYTFDKSMVIYCGRNGLKYSRYCDDIIISSNSIIVNQDEVKNQIRHELCKKNLELNEQKTSYMSGSKLKVSNIYIKEKLYIPNQKFKSLYNLLIKILNANTKEKVKKVISEYKRLNSGKVQKEEKKMTITHMLNEIRGLISYYIHINNLQYQVAKVVNIFNIVISELEIEGCKPIYNIPMYNSVLHVVLQSGDVHFLPIEKIEKKCAINISNISINEIKYIVSCVNGIERKHYVVNNPVKIENYCEVSDLLLDVDLPNFKAIKQEEIELIKKQIDYFWVRRQNAKTTKEYN